MTACTRTRVSSRSSSGLFSAFDTVCRETPARSATVASVGYCSVSRRVGLIGPPHVIGAVRILGRPWFRPLFEWNDQIIGRAPSFARLIELVGVGTYVRTMAKGSAPKRAAAAAYHCGECGWE